MHSISVPLHVLHTRWGSDADSDDDWRRTNVPTQVHRIPRIIPSTSKPQKHLRCDKLHKKFNCFDLIFLHFI